MSVTYDHDAKCKTLGDAGFSDAQIAALMSVTDQPASLRPAPRRRAPVESGTITQTITLSILAVAGLGSLLMVLIRVA